MAMQDLSIRRVAVIGAGISGVVSAAHLLNAGLEVTVYERNKEVGGIWLHSNEIAIEEQYPCLSPSDAARVGHDNRSGPERQSLLHAPPGPCYDSLVTNIPTPLLQTTLNPWPPGTPRLVGHHATKEYIQTTAKKTGVDKIIIYGASVTRVEKEGAVWAIDWTVLEEDKQHGRLSETKYTAIFDAVVVASGHYHTPRIPDIPGLAEAKSKWPSRISHSKFYRNSSSFQGKNVLLIGGGVSSTDIAKDISCSAHNIYQSTRNGRLDMPASALPHGAIRVSEMAAVETIARGTSSCFVAHLKDNRSIPNIDKIIICTGYQITLPFFPQYNNNSVDVMDADERVLITDGTQVHNLHRDIFYIPDPTLAFVGLPLFNTTFTLFEFQAISIAAFFSGTAQLPRMEDLREEYKARVRKKGYGRYFHSLKDDEETYVSSLVRWVNEKRTKQGLCPIDGHTALWREEKELIYQQILKLRAIKAAEKLEESKKVLVECT